MSKAILTLPMMPVDGTNYGKYVTPILCEILKKNYDGLYYQCINLLDCFNNREENLNNYLCSLEDNYINYDRLWYDKDNIDKFLNNINYLIKKEYIIEMYSDVYTCGCGVIEIEESKISSCNPQNLKFEFRNDEMYCKICNGKCEKNKEKILAFIPHNITKEQLLFLPAYLNKDKKTYDNTIIKSYTTISRKRNTGVSIKYNGTNYNIDIDFLWATYLANFDEEEKIVVSGNRMLYQLFLVGVVEKCIKPESKTLLLGTPYITDIKSITNDVNFVEDEISRKLGILFNMKWSKKEKNFDGTILKFLNSISEEKKQHLYDIISRKRTYSCSFYEDLNDNLMHQMNMQECVKLLKKERR